MRSTGKIFRFVACALMCVGVSHGEQPPTQGLDLHAAPDAPDPAFRDALLALRAKASDPLSPAQLAAFKKLMLEKGWPPVVSVGKEAVNAAGELALWSWADYPLQVGVENVLGERAGLDVDAAAFAWLNDRIELKQTGKQQFGMFLAVDHGHAIIAPPVAQGKANFDRDFAGLPTLAEYLADAQKKLDAGQSLADIQRSPSLAGEARSYAEPAFRHELGVMIDADQGVRHEWAAEGGKADDALLARMKSIDAANLKSLKAFVASHGFPTVAMVGRDGVSTAFLLVQHADADPAFQQHALEQLAPLAERHELPRREFAMLQDRVLIADGKPQRYGTQAKIHDGHAVVLPVEDPANLDERRASIAMGKEAAYLDALEKQFTAKDKNS